MTSYILRKARCGLFIFGLLGAAVMLVPAASGATSAERQQLDRGGRLPMLTQPDAKRYARSALRWKFDSYEYSNGKRVRCGKRLSRTRRRCEVKFWLGDTSYKGHVMVWYYWRNGDVWWDTSGKVKQLDSYCLATGGSRAKCTKTHRWD